MVKNLLISLFLILCIIQLHSMGTGETNLPKPDQAAFENPKHGLTGEELVERAAQELELQLHALQVAQAPQAPKKRKRPDEAATGQSTPEPTDTGVIMPQMQRFAGLFNGRGAPNNTGTNN